MTPKTPPQKGPPSSPTGKGLRFWGQVVALILLGLLTCGMVVGMVITAMDMAQQEQGSQPLSP